jgi:hypothetical protein
MNYRAWVERAVEFTNGLSTLRGKISLTAEALPPMSEAGVQALNRDLRLPLPSQFVIS